MVLLQPVRFQLVLKVLAVLPVTLCVCMVKNVSAGTRSTQPDMVHEQPAACVAEYNSGLPKTIELYVSATPTPGEEVVGTGGNSNGLGECTM